MCEIQDCKVYFDPYALSVPQGMNMGHKIALHFKHRLYADTGLNIEADIIGDTNGLNTLTSPEKV